MFFFLNLFHYFRAEILEIPDAMITKAIHLKFQNKIITYRWIIVTAEVAL